MEGDRRTVPCGDLALSQETRVVTVGGLVCFVAVFYFYFDNKIFYGVTFCLILLSQSLAGYVVEKVNSKLISYIVIAFTL